MKAIDAVDESHVSELPAVLHHLVEREFIQPRESSAFVGTIEYTFTGNMLREMLLATLVNRQVAVYYGAAARWLIASSGRRVDEYNVLIAQYYEKAGEQEQAADYWQRAGKRSLNISAYLEARTNFEHVLSLLPADHSELPGLTIQLGTANYYLADYPLARQHLQAGLKISRDRNDPQKTAQALYWLSQIANETDGNYAEAKQYLEEGLQLVRSTQTESALEARILYGLGDVGWRLGTIDQAHDYCQQSIDLAQNLGDTNTELYALNRMGSLSWPHDPETAGTFFQRVYDKAITYGDRERAAHAINNLGYVAMKQGDFVKAKSFIEQAIGLTKEIGQQQHSSAGWMVDSLIDVSLKLGDTHTARSYVVSNLKFAHQIGLLPLLVNTVIQAGRILLQENPMNDRGLELFGLVLNHPACDLESRQVLHQALADSNLSLDDPRVSAVMESGKLLDLDQTVEKLLVDFRT